MWSISTRAIQCEIGFGRLIEEVGGGKCTTSKGQRYLNGISDEICPSFPYRRLIRYRLYALYFLEVRPWKNTFLSKQMEFLHLAYIKSWLIFFSFFSLEIILHYKIPEHVISMKTVQIFELRFSVQWKSNVAAMAGYNHCATVMCLSIAPHCWACPIKSASEDD